MENADFNLPEGLLIRKVRGNWLTQKPNAQAWTVAGLSIIVLLIANFLFWRNDFNLENLMMAVPQNVFEGHEYWRLWTALFAHADIAHLLSNSMLFSIFAYSLFGHFGSFVFPGAALIFGGLINYIVLKEMPPSAELLGISGVVYWMGAVWLTLYFLLETRERTSKRLIKTVGIALMLFIPETYHRDVSYLSHFTGFAFGMVFALLYYWSRRETFQKAEVTELVEA
jgi:rhomboid protease GluP